MKHGWIACLALAGVFAVLMVGAAAAGGPAGPSFPAAPGLSYVDNEILVGYEAGTSEQEQQNIQNDVQATTRKSSVRGRTFCVSGRVRSPRRSRPWRSSLPSGTRSRTTSITPT